MRRVLLLAASVALAGYQEVLNAGLVDRPIREGASSDPCQLENTYAMSSAIEPTIRAMPSVACGHRRAIGSTGA